MQADGKTVYHREKKAWLPFLWIITACALAHLWCLGAQFYMDDFPQILDSPQVRAGDFLQGLNSWTNLGYVIQYRICGPSPLAFHAVNWLLHTSIALVLYVFGRDFLKDQWPTAVALCAALLFASPHLPG